MPRRGTAGGAPAGAGHAWRAAGLAAALAVAALAVAKLAALLAGAPPPSFTVPIRDAEILLPPAAVAIAAEPGPPPYDSAEEEAVVADVAPLAATAMAAGALSEIAPESGPLPPPDGGFAVLARPRAAPAALRAPPAPARAIAALPAPPPLPALAAPPPAAVGADRPLIAIVLWELGRSAEAARGAIERLPAQVTLGLRPGAPDARRWSELALADGHELVLEVPMEPLGYPAVDPGAGALLTTLAAAENLRRLDVWLAGFDGYVGVTNLMGSRFTASARHMRPVLQALRPRGLVFLDSRAAGDSIAYELAGELGLARAINDRYIDNEPTAAAIDARLGELEAAARARGAAVGIGHPSPLTVERLAAWLPGLAERRLRLAPLSAVAAREARP